MRLSVVIFGLSTTFFLYSYYIMVCVISHYPVLKAWAAVTRVGFYTLSISNSG